MERYARRCQLWSAMRGGANYGVRRQSEAATALSLDFTAFMTPKWRRASLAAALPRHYALFNARRKKASLASRARTSFKRARYVFPHGWHLSETTSLSRRSSFACASSWTAYGLP